MLLTLGARLTSPFIMLKLTCVYNLYRQCTGAGLFTRLPARVLFIMTGYDNDILAFASAVVRGSLPL
jgi:hypothetical protein